jgi:hypothetical protein
LKEALANVARARKEAEAEARRVEKHKVWLAQEKVYHEMLRARKVAQEAKLTEHRKRQVGHWLNALLNKTVKLVTKEQREEQQRIMTEHFHIRRQEMLEQVTRSKPEIFPARSQTNHAPCFCVTAGTADRDSAAAGADHAG